MPNRNMVARRWGSTCMPNPSSWDYKKLLLAHVEHKAHTFNARAISSDFRFLGSFRLIKRVPLNKTLVLTPGFPHTGFITMPLRRYSGISPAVHRTSWREGSTRGSYSGGLRFRSLPEYRKQKGFQIFLFPHANSRNSTLIWTTTASLQMLSKPGWWSIRSETCCLLKTKYSRAPLNLDGEPSE